MNWTREKEPPTASATVRTVSVLARPGTPSISRCPPASRRDEHALEQVVLAGDDAADLEQRGLERGGGLGRGALAGVEGGERDGCHAAE